MADAITIKALQDASLDAKSLEEVVNGDEAKQVTTRLGENYPSVKKAIKILFENGGIADRFKTLADLQVSPLVDGAYALVADDSIANNGIYIKQGGDWVKSKYDPVSLANAYTDELPKWSYEPHRKNLFDINNDVVSGKFVNFETGSLLNNELSTLAEVSVEPNTIYTLSGLADSTNNARMRMAVSLIDASGNGSKPLKESGQEYTYYSLVDADSSTNGGKGTFKTRADTVSVMFNVKYGSAAIHDKAQLEVGNTATAFETYKKKQIDADRLLTVQDTISNSIQDIYNYIDSNYPSSVVTDFDVVPYTINSDGDISPLSSAYETAAFVPVKPKTRLNIKYKSNSSYGIAAYDEQLTFLRFLDKGNSQLKELNIEVPDDVYYISVTNDKTNTDFVISRVDANNSIKQAIDTGEQVTDSVISFSDGRVIPKSEYNVTDYIAVKKGDVYLIELTEVGAVSSAIVYFYNTIKTPSELLKRHIRGFVVVKAPEDGFIRYSYKADYPTSIYKIINTTNLTQKVIDSSDEINNLSETLESNVDLAIQFDEYKKQRKATSQEIVASMIAVGSEAQWYGYEYVENYGGVEQDKRISSSESTMSLHATLPIQNRMRRCVCDRFTGEVLYYLDANDSSKKANGKPAKLDGTDGNVMVEIPDFYYKCEQEPVVISGETYNKVRIKISEFCIESDWVYSRKCYTSAFEATIDRELNILASVVSANFGHTTQEVITESETVFTKASTGYSHGQQLTATVSGFTGNATRYRGGVNNSAYDATSAGHTDFERNQLGRPLANMNRSQVKQYVPSKAMTIHKYDTLVALTVLYIVEYATTNPQQDFAENSVDGYKQGGTGLGSTRYPAYAAFEKFWSPQGGITVLPNGSTIKLGNNTGQVFYEMQNVPLSTDFSSRADVYMPVLSYRGVEQFYGHAYKIVDQANFWTYLDGDGVKVSEFWYQPNPYRLSDEGIDGYKYMGNQFTVQHAIGEGTFVTELLFSEDSNMFSAIAKTASPNQTGGSGKYGNDFAENLLHGATDKPQVYYQTFNGRIVSGNLVGLFFSCSLYPAVGFASRPSDTTRLDHY